MAGRAAHHRFPPDPAAVARAGFAADRGLDPRHRGRPGHRVPQPAVARYRAHAPGGATRPGRAGRPRQSLCRLRRRRPHRLQLHRAAVQQHHRYHHHQREPVQPGLGWRLAPRHQRGRSRLVGGDADPMARRDDARREERHPHPRHLARSRHRRHRRARLLAGGQLPGIALPHRAEQGRGAGVQPVAAGDHPVCVGRLRQRRNELRLRHRRRHLLEAQRPLPAQCDAQPRLRPGRERPAGRQLQRERDLLQRQAPLLHREPELLRRAVRGAQQRQPADLYPSRRRECRRRQWCRRRDGRGETQRQPGRDELRRVRRHRSG